MIDVYDKDCFTLLHVKKTSENCRRMIYQNYLTNTLLVDLSLSLFTNI